MARYSNFYFSNLIYDEDFYLGTFISRDDNVICDFEYNRHTKHFRIWNNNQPIDEIMPIPVWWLDRKLEQNGELKANESRICY